MADATLQKDSSPMGTLLDMPPCMQQVPMYVPLFCVHCMKSPPAQSKKLVVNQVRSVSYTLLSRESAFVHRVHFMTWKSIKKSHNERTGEIFQFVWTNGREFIGYE